jgi:hypothetical protein
MAWVTEQSLTIAALIVCASATVALVMIAPQAVRHVHRAERALREAEALMARAGDVSRHMHDLLDAVEAEADRTGESVGEVAARLLRATR